MKSQGPRNLAGNLSLAVTKEALTYKEFCLLFQKFEENNIPDWWDFSNLELLRFLLLLSIPAVLLQCNNQIWKQQRGACGKYRELCWAVWTAAQTHQTDTSHWIVLAAISKLSWLEILLKFQHVKPQLFLYRQKALNRNICPCPVASWPTKLDTPNRSQFLSSCHTSLIWGGCCSFFLGVCDLVACFFFLFLKSEHRIVSCTAAQPRSLVTEGHITCSSQSPWKRI